MSEADRVPAGTPRIAFVTRAVSRNQGNVALSRVWHRLLCDAFPHGRVATLERIPNAFKRYDRAFFAAQDEPVRAFDALAHKLARRSTRAPATAQDYPIKLDPNTAQRSRLRGLRGLKLRAWAARMGSFHRAFVARAGTIATCDLMVLNAAGEFMPTSTDTPIQYMLDLRVAQLLGLRTAFVNTSFQITDPLTLGIALHTLEAADCVIFRDRVSEACYRAAGGKRVLHVHPDAAMLLAPPRPPGPPSRRIGLALAGPLATTPCTRDCWLDLALGLRAAGYEPVFVSNEWYSDASIFAPWAADHGFETYGLGVEVDPYIDLLAGFDAVVSARLHTGVLAVLAGAALVPVELATTKISGYFDGLGIDVVPQSLAGGDDWVARTLAAVQALSQDKAAVVARQQSAMATAAASLRNDLAPILRDLAPLPAPAKG